VQEIASPGIAPRVADWALDGQSLVFAGADAEGHRLWRLGLSGASSPAPVSDYGWWSVHVAPEGVFAERVYESGVWRLDPAGAELLTPEVNDRGDIPSWTIFRGRIYYVYVQNSDNARLFSRPTAGGAATFHAHIPTPYDGGGLAVDPITGDVIYARLVSSSDDIGLARLTQE
jgi:hypothetical protein